MEIVFTPKAEQDLLFWKKSGNIRVQKKITQLLNSILSTPFEGLGKPEALKHNLSGLWSRRITSEHRLVYAVEDDKIILIQLKYHY